MEHELRHISVFPESVWESNDPRQRFAALYQAVIHPGIAYLLTEFPPDDQAIQLHRRWEKTAQNLSIMEITHRYNLSAKNDPQQPYVGHVVIDNTIMSLHNATLYHLEKVEAVRQVEYEHYVIENELVRKAAWIARRYFTEHRFPRKAFLHMEHYAKDPYDASFHRAEIIVALGDNHVLTFDYLQSYIKAPVIELKRILMDLQTKNIISLTDDGYQLTAEAQDTIYAKFFRPLATLSGIPEPVTESHKEPETREPATPNRRTRGARESSVLPPKPPEPDTRREPPVPITTPELEPAIAIKSEIQSAAPPPAEPSPSEEPESILYMGLTLPPDLSAWNAINITPREEEVLKAVYEKLPLYLLQKSGLTKYDIQTILRNLQNKLSQYKGKKTHVADL